MTDPLADPEVYGTMDEGVVEGGMTGEQLRSVRQRLGLTQAEMADLIGISRRRLIQLEQGFELVGDQQKPTTISLTIELAVIAVCAGYRGGWDGRGRPRRVVGEIADED